MEQILSPIEKCVYQSAIEDFNKYILKLRDCKKWMIHSDYCFGDKDKPNDVAVFSILPHLTTYEDMRQFVSKNFPKDIKKIAKIENKTLSTLNSGLFFHFCFIFEKRRVLFSNSANGNEKENLKQAIRGIKKIIDCWQIGENAKSYYESLDKKLKLVLTKIERNSFNIRLLNDILLISLLSAFIAHLLTKEANAELVGWFSDRDNMTSYLDGIAYNLFHLNHQGLSKRDSIDTKKREILIGIPNQTESSNWFDQLNRIPDYIAGALADLHTENHTVSKNKFNQVLKGMVDNPNYGIFKCTFNVEGCSCGELFLYNK